VLERQIAEAGEGGGGSASGRLWATAPAADIAVDGGVVDEEAYPAADDAGRRGLVGLAMTMHYAAAAAAADDDDDV